MAWPMIAAAAIGAGGNLLGGLLGNSAQEEANAMNYQIALMNYYAQEQARRDAQYEAQRQETETKLGTTDEEGNRRYFKPGVGWVSTRGPKGLERAALYDREETAQLAQDLPAKRKHMFDELAAQGREGNAAGGILEAMLRNYRDDPSAAVSRRNRMTAEAANEGFDTGMTEALKDALRTGTKGQADIASRVGRDKYKALRTAFLENAEGAAEESEANFMNEQGNYANRYNQLATRRSARPQADYNPRNDSQESALQSAMSSGRSAGGALLNAFGQPASKLDFQHEPNFGLANTIQQVGAGLAGSLNLYDSTRGQGMQNYGSYAKSNYFPTAPSGNSNPRNADWYKSNVGPW